MIGIGGKIAVGPDPGRNLLLQQFAVEAGPDWAPRFNIAPTQSVPIVRMNSEGVRELVLLRWGLIPSWAKDPAIGNRMINARSETVAEKPSFRSAFKRRRCLVPADGYYEWQKTDAGKLPYYIRFDDDQPFAMAGLWESWRSGHEDAVQSFTIITTDANESTCQVHDRMPVIVEPHDYPMWLDPDFQESDSLQSLLHPYAGDELRLDRVSTLVNNPRNDDPQCIVPCPSE